MERSVFFFQWAAPPFFGQLKILWAAPKNKVGSSIIFFLAKFRYFHENHLNIDRIYWLFFMFLINFGYFFQK